MEQGGSNAFRIHAQIQHQAGHGQRVADVGLAAAAADPVVRLVGKVVGSKVLLFPLIYVNNLI